MTRRKSETFGVEAHHGLISKRLSELEPGDKFLLRLRDVPEPVTIVSMELAPSRRAWWVTLEEVHYAVSISSTLRVSVV